MTKQRIKFNRVIVMLLTLLMTLSMFMAFSSTRTYATAHLSPNGANTVSKLLKEPISGNAVIDKYKQNWKLGDELPGVSVRSQTEPKTLKLFKTSDKSNDKSPNTFTFVGTDFQDIKDAQLQEAVINEFAKLMADRYRESFTDADRQAIYNEVKDNCGQANAAMVAALFQDTKADMFSALRIFQPFGGVVGTILGVFVVCIIVLILGSTALDIAYINIPIARNFMYGKEKDGGGDKGPKKPWGITHDAWSVVDECEGDSGKDGGYKNANIAYFKRRVITYIVVAIMILYLLSGQLSDIIAWVMKLVSGFSIG